jgi:glycosyltransferase involved in cell wall biosynthesis
MADDKRIRVLHLVTRMNVGGVAVLIDNLLENIDSSKYEVLLVTGSCEAPEGDYLDSRNPNYRFIRLANFHKSLKIKDDVSSTMSLIKIIHEFKPDIIHTHTSKAGLYGRLLARLFSPKSKIVHTFHGHLLVGYFNPIKLGIVKLIEKTLSQLSDSLVAMGTQVRDDLVSVKVAPKAKFSVFFPGLNFPEFPTRSVARENLNLDSSYLYCVFIGRLTRIKRPDRLLEVSKVVSQSNPQVKFLVVGDGDLANEMKEKSKAQNLPVQFLGWRQDISTILAAADLLILTSDNEAVALTLIEASQAGIPVVTTPAGSVRDIAVDGLNGFVAEFAPESLASKVLVLAESADLRKQMGAAGKERARELFSIAHMVKSHDLLYKELLSS